MSDGRVGKKRGGRVIRLAQPIHGQTRVKKPKKPKMAANVSRNPPAGSHFPREYINGLALPKPPTREEMQLLPQWGLSQFAFEELQKHSPSGHEPSLWMTEERWSSLSSSQRDELLNATSLFNKRRYKWLCRLDYKLRGQDDRLNSARINESQPNQLSKPLVSVGQTKIDATQREFSKSEDSSVVRVATVRHPTAPDMFKPVPGRDENPRRAEEYESLPPPQKPIEIVFSPHKNSASIRPQCDDSNPVSIPPRNGESCAASGRVMPKTLSVGVENDDQPTVSGVENNMRMELPPEVLTYSSSDDVVTKNKTEPSGTCSGFDLPVSAQRDANLPKPRGKKKPVEKITEVIQFQRDVSVKTWVLVNAKGRCECCAKPAPFRNADGQPYLEVHHLRRLADGGSDSVQNSVALCPNCHRELHYGERGYLLMKLLYKQIKRLVSE